MKPLLRQPPASVCILQPSPGELCQALPMVRTLQAAWPQTAFTWVVGGSEASLLSEVKNLEVLAVGANGFAATRRLRQLLGQRTFDVLLHLQPSLRASAMTLPLRARIKLGLDRARARGWQWLFTTDRIEAAPRQHLVDTYFGFAERLGVRERFLRWDIPIPAAAREYAERIIPDGGLTLALAPFAPQRVRLWRPEYYAQVADFAAAAYGVRLVLCGGRAPGEQRIVEGVARALRKPPIDATGRESPHDLLALFKRATLLIAPDSDAAHWATAVGTPVLGLYAATNSARIGPYLSRQLCVDRFDSAARALLGRSALETPWHTVIDREGVMDLITPDEVIRKLQSFMAQRMKRR